MFGMHSIKLAPIFCLYLIFSKLLAFVKHVNLPQQDLPKSKRTNCTIYGSRRLTYHQGERSGLVNEHVSGVKKADVEPSMAFCGVPEPSVEICIGALPAATLSTEN